MYFLIDANIKLIVAIKSTECSPVQAPQWRAAPTLSSSSVFPTLPPSLMTAGAPTSDDTHYNQVSQHALSLVVQLLWQLHDNLTGFRGKKERQWINSVFLNSLLTPVDHCTGEAGVWLPGLPVGSHHDQLLPHHRGHLGPVRCHPVQITLHYTGEGTLVFPLYLWKVR